MYKVYCNEACTTVIYGSQSSASPSAWPSRLIWTARAGAGLEVRMRGDFFCQCLRIGAIDPREEGMRTK